MAKYLYEVCFERGRSNPEHAKFLRNVMRLNAKVSDYGGINNVCVIAHHMSKDIVFDLCAEGLKKSKGDLSVIEITKKTLTSQNSSHRLFLALIENYFLPHDDYPNIK
ncbi:hypothetical protein [Ferribacterium limneticum]|uniref:hypothetical protein n=1 Tax=Ferribacterium limneticum TaxID=76259 RepID=UPI001CFB1208|nr:hypothetical protein [Ferribacterium limneticum]UCV27580.1 hypothetical protein KI617_15065 [Ferribacterium limneticum]UCV31497.1 hypothetical protein KI608_15065 [Ferribacterium limneticum]